MTSLIPLFMALSVLTTSLPAQARRYYKPIPLHQALTTELNGVLKSANDMHSAFFGQNEEKIEASVDQLLKSIDNASGKINFARSQKTHLKKMLDHTKDQLNQIKNSSGKDRKDSLTNAMEQLVLIAKTYKLDKYRIFFCPKDKVTWLQKDWKPQNPVHPKLHRSCGKPAS